MRQLASIQKITRLDPIPDRDRIVLASMEDNAWRVIVRKDDYNIGDLCVYVEIDSVLPQKPEFEFLAKNNYRIKTMKMAGVLSQGICFPLSILPKRDTPYKQHEDVTEIIGVKHYDEYPEIEEVVVENSKKTLKSLLYRFKFTRKLAQKIYGKPKKKGFPSFIPKTDETRIQNAPWMLDGTGGFVCTEKVDGTSFTAYLKKNHGLISLFKPYEYGVCSRNQELERDDSFYWKVSDKYDIEFFLRNFIEDVNREWVCLQGEIIGPKIQGNKYERDEYELYGFNLMQASIIDPYDLLPVRLLTLDAKPIAEHWGIPWVPIVSIVDELPDTVDEMLEAADGISRLHNRAREGLVVRAVSSDTSFKAVSNKFLLKEGE